MVAAEENPTGGKAAEDDGNEEGWEQVKGSKSRKSSGSIGDSNNVHGNTHNSPNPKKKLNLLERMSMAFYVTNFPHQVTAKDLWKKCMGIGTVVDVFIPNRLSKAGRRFGFVKFIKVDNAAQLLSNLKGIWFGNYHMFADLVRYSRNVAAKNPNSSRVSEGKAVKETAKVTEAARSFSNNTHTSSTSSYAHVVKGNIPSPSPVSSRRIIKVVNPTVEPKTSTSLLLKVIDPAFIPYVKLWLQEEGFVGVSVSYIGGRWVNANFGSVEAKTRFVLNDSFKSKFCAFKAVCNNFIPDERLTWVEIHGVPKGAWKSDTFNDILKPWGNKVFNLNEWEESAIAKVCVLSQVKSVIFEELSIDMNDNVFNVWIKEFAPWEPELVDGINSDSGSDEDSVGTDSDSTASKDDIGSNVDLNICKDGSEDDSNPVQPDEANVLEKENEISSPGNGDADNMHSEGDNVDGKHTSNDIEFNPRPTAECKIPSEAVVFPSDYHLNGQMMDQNSKAPSEDIFSINRIINEMATEHHDTAHSGANQVSTSSSGAPGFIRGVYSWVEDGKVTYSSQTCAAAKVMSGTSNAVNNQTNLVLIGKEMGIKVGDDPRPFSQIVNGMNDDQGFQ